MGMSKTRKGAIIILGIILIPFFAYKLYSLNDYNFFNGKVINIEEANVSIPHIRGSGGYEIVYMPEVMYLRGKDTVTFVEGHRNTFAFLYDIGDGVTVIESKFNPDDTQILTFWYYIEQYEIILLALISSVVISIYWGISTGYFKE